MNSNLYTNSEGTYIAIPWDLETNQYMNEMRFAYLLFTCCVLIFIPFFGILCFLCSLVPMLFMIFKESHLTHIRFNDQSNMLEIKRYEIRVKSERKIVLEKEIPYKNVERITHEDIKDFVGVVVKSYIIFHLHSNLKPIKIPYHSSKGSNCTRAQMKEICQYILKRINEGDSSSQSDSSHESVTPEVKIELKPVVNIEEEKKIELVTSNNTSSTIIASSEDSIPYNNTSSVVNEDSIPYDSTTTTSNEVKRKGNDSKKCCKICNVNDINVFFLPCGHTYCSGCAKKIFGKNEPCSFCKGKVEEIQELF